MPMAVNVLFDLLKSYKNFNSITLMSYSITFIMYSFIHYSIIYLFGISVIYFSLGLEVGYSG